MKKIDERMGKDGRKTRDKWEEFSDPTVTFPVDRSEIRPTLIYYTKRIIWTMLRLSVSGQCSVRA